LIVVLGLFLVIGRPVRAQQAKASSEPRQAKRRLIPLTINKGETYIISNVSVSGAPGIKVVANPNAFVVNTMRQARLYWSVPTLAAEISI
jgi:hypothetical protein